MVHIASSARLSQFVAEALSLLAMSVLLLTKIAEVGSREAT